MDINGEPNEMILALINYAGSDFTACCSGKATTGAPTGYIIKIAGRDAYITGDRRNKACMEIYFISLLIIRAFQ